MAMLRSRDSAGDDDEPPPLTPGCCVFLLHRRPSSLGYRPLTFDDDDGGGGGGGGGEEPSSAAVTVVVGKERRVFLVDPVVLQGDLFRVLLGMTAARRGGGGQGKGDKKRKRGGRGVVGPIFVNVDAILFEHLLWLAEKGGGEGEENGRGGPSLLRRNLEEIVEFYAQDF